MTKLFRRIRIALLANGRFSKYLLYAFGEIILVVVGILIALQINNWNEAKIEQKELLAIYEEIKADLLNDIQESGYIIDWWEEEEPKITNFITLTESDTKNLDSIANKDFMDGLSYWPFAVTNSAFKKLNDQKSKYTDTDKAIIKQLNRLYVENYAMLTSGLENFSELAIGYSKKLYETHDWMPLKRHDLSREARTYFLNDLTHRRHLKVYKSYGKTFLSDIISHYQESLMAYVMIHQLTSPQQPLPEALLKNNPIFSKKERTEYCGTYRVGEYEMIIKDLYDLLFMTGNDNRDIYSEGYLLLHEGKDSIGFFDSKNSFWHVQRDSLSQVEGIEFKKEGSNEGNYLKKVD